MTNGNKPINTCIESINHNGVVEITTSEFGLTKREYFAVHRKDNSSEGIGLLTAKLLMNSEPPKDALDNIKWWINAEERLSVIHADALIDALNKQK